MRCQDAPDLFERTIKVVAEHRAVLHALQRANPFASVAVHFDFHGDEAIEAVLEHDVCAVAGLELPLHMPEPQTGFAQYRRRVGGNSLHKRAMFRSFATAKPRRTGMRGALVLFLLREREEPPDALEGFLRDLFES